MFSETAMFGDTSSDQRMRDLHQDGSRTGESACQFAVDLPEHRRRREERLSHGLIVAQVCKYDDRARVKPLGGLCQIDPAVLVSRLLIEHVESLTGFFLRD